MSYLGNMRGPGEGEAEQGKTVYQVAGRAAARLTMLPTRQAPFEELSCLSSFPARELRDLHKDLWLR